MEQKKEIWRREWLVGIYLNDRTIEIQLSKYNLTNKHNKKYPNLILLKKFQYFFIEFKRLFNINNMPTIWNYNKF